MALTRLSEMEALLLRLLIQRPRAYGLELVGMSEGNLRKGTVYTTLARMQGKGLVVAFPEDPPPTAGIPRRFYEATDLGVRTLRALEKAARQVEAS